MADTSIVKEVKVVKEKVWNLFTQRPFTPFRIVMESGEVVNVEHPENFSMWPGPESSTFHLYAEGGRAIYAHFAKVTSVEVRENGSD